MRKRVQTMALFLTLALSFTVLPVSAFADGTDDQSPEVSSESRDDDDGGSSSSGGSDDDDSSSASNGDDDDSSSGGDDDDSSSDSDDSKEDIDEDDDDDDGRFQYMLDDDDDDDPAPWIERIKVPAYARDLYDMLEDGSDSDDGDDTDFLIQDANFRVDSSAPAVPNKSGVRADRAEIITFSLPDPYTGGGLNSLDTMAFTNEDFYSVAVSEGDQAIDYNALKQGDVVKPPNFNGVFVTKLAIGSDFEQKKKDAVAYAATVFQAFDRDHPEVFWLSGKCRIRTISTNAPGSGRTAYLFLVLADKEGFTMRSDGWKAGGALADGIRRRDAAIDKILASVTGQTAQEKIRQLNRWLTENNQYNTTPDLTTIGNEPHECLSALEGRTGVNGPVCDGYTRAFKVLCDRLGIGCVLENGYAKTTLQSEGGFHMWNAAQIGTDWYGVDVTWNDPTVAGSTGAKSGKENEDYLLLGADSQVRGMKFRDSHPATNRAIPAGVAFTNSPALSPAAYSNSGASAGTGGFGDVKTGDYFAKPVLWAVEKKITAGTSKTSFSPNQNCTVAQILTFLWRANGAPKPVEGNPFSDVKASDYYASAASWAREKGLISGTVLDGNAPCTRSMAVTYMWKAAGSPSAKSAGFSDVPSDAEYAKAVAWAVEKGITSGTSARTFSPDNVCTRGQIVTFLYRGLAG